MAKSDRRSSIEELSSRNAVFREYKRRTGNWPVLSMAAYFGRFVLMLAAISFLFWYGRLHPANVNRITIYFFAAFLAGIFIWNVLESLAWNYDLRRKKLTEPGSFLSPRQMPSARR